MLYESYSTYQAAFTPWFAVNHLPVVRDSSHGFWRRVRLIAFERTFAGPNIDKDLFRKLKGEAEGIRAWMVRGCLEWRRRGLAPPGKVAQATGRYRSRNDNVLEFLDACCERTPAEKVQAKRLFEAYREWCRNEGISDDETLTMRSFGDRMKRDTKHEKRGNIYYLGIQLRVPETDERRDDVRDHSTQSR